MKLSDYGEFVNELEMTVLGKQAAAILRNLENDRDEAVKQLVESRGRFGDMEARVVELEAVNAEALKVLQKHGLRGGLQAAVIGAKDVLCSSPSVVLADHDKEVAAQAWAEGFDAGERDVFEHDRHADGWDSPCIPNPYRVADQNGEHA